MALTPEEQRAKDAGWETPEGSDLISRGDDAIRHNAARARQADADTLVAAQQYTDAEIEHVPSQADIERRTQHSPHIVPSADTWRFAETDEFGNMSRGVDPQGRTWLRPHPASPGMADPEAGDMIQSVDAPGYAWAITDETGSVALGVTASGGVVGADSATAAPYDVVLLVGQSNMRGQGLPFIGRGETVPGIDQFPAWDHADHGSIIPAADPLGFSGIWSNPPYTGLVMPFALRYRQENPQRRVLLVTAARGATAFSSTDSYHWDWTRPDSGVDLAARAIQQTKDALAAAGPNARLAGILWHQGEGDLGISDQYADKLDGLMQHFRTELDAPDVPVVIGQMSLDRALIPSRLEVDAAHQQTPARLERSAFAPSPDGLHNPGDPTHFGTRALDIMGERFYEALKRAAHNVAGAAPIGPENVRAVRTGDVITVTWEPAWSRVTDYLIEWRAGNESWSVVGVEHPLSVGLTATIEARADEVRVTSINETGSSTPVSALVEGSVRTLSLDLSGSVHTDQGWNPEYGPSVNVSRYGPVVELTVSSLQRTDGGATGNYSVLDLPDGFRPISNKYPQTWRDAMVYVHVGGLVRITHPVGSLDYFSVTYMTDDPMPD